MFDPINQGNWLKLGLTIAGLLLVTFVAIYLFNVPLNIIFWIVFLGSFAWVHMGMHGSDGGYRGHNANGEEHSRHTAQTTARLNRFLGSRAWTSSAGANVARLEGMCLAEILGGVQRHHKVLNEREKEVKYDYQRYITRQR